ncbi:hypothetical protein [Campylobacter sp.]|uniref:hypothetical protein n=1 Tax=Campylobacter sp. TaxID=205 RepID=UPI002A83B08F|nr:hypothetical protein [Campylobacter sp.]MDY4445467.1 hypothetical protein [Campylobacter sp.]
MSKKSIQKISGKEIQQKIKRREKTKKFIEAKIERLKNQLKLENNSTTIPQKIKILEYNKQRIEAKIEKLKNRLKELESKVLKSTSTTKEKAKNQARKIKTQKYFTDASKRNGKTKIAIYSPTKDIKQAKEIANCNIVQAEFSAILWAFNQAISNKENAIIYNDSSSSIEKAKKEFKEHKNIEFLWIPRKENKIADKLARG